MKSVSVNCVPERLTFEKDPLFPVPTLEMDILLLFCVDLTFCILLCIADADTTPIECPSLDVVVATVSDEGISTVVVDVGPVLVEIAKDAADTKVSQILLLMLDSWSCSSTSIFASVTCSGNFSEVFLETPSNGFVAAGPEAIEAAATVPPAAPVAAQASSDCCALLPLDESDRTMIAILISNYNIVPCVFDKGSKNTLNNFFT